MAKAPKKRNKKYNPHKTPISRLRIVPESQALGFTFDQLSPLCFGDAATQLEIPAEDVNDVTAYLPELAHHHVIWTSPEQAMPYSSRPREYAAILIDTAQIYARTLNEVLKVPFSEVQAWYLGYRQRVDSALMQQTIGNTNETVV